MDDKYEIERERQRKIIENHSRMLEKNRNKLLENVLSFEEMFDKAFFKIAKKTTFSGTSLFKCLNNQVLLVKNLQDCIIIKNNMGDESLDNLLDIVKNNNLQNFLVFSKYKEKIKFEKKYIDVFLYDYDITYTIHTTTSQFSLLVRSFTSFHNVQYFDLQKQNKNAQFPKFSLSEKINFEETETIHAKSDCNKKFADIYNKIKKQIIKDVNENAKKIASGTNYMIRGIKFNKLLLKHYLVPIYNLRCHKPGFDIKYKICGNAKIIIQ